MTEWYPRIRLTDRVLNRRTSWNGAVVQDLSGMGTNPHFGNYYRVTASERDPKTGGWAIYWRLVEDRIERPADEPVYKFDGTTWDLPAVPATVFPKRWAAIVAVVAALLTVLVPAFWNEEDAAIAPFAIWLFAAIAIAWDWFFKIEPVRGTKIGATLTVAAAARTAANKREHNRWVEEANKHSGVLNYIREMDPETARRFGFTPEDLR